MVSVSNCDTFNLWNLYVPPVDGGPYSCDGGDSQFVGGEAYLNLYLEPNPTGLGARMPSALSNTGALYCASPVEGLGRVVSTQPAL